MLPHRYSPFHLLVPIRFGLSELRDGFARWREVRWPHPAMNYDPDGDLCGRFADCLEKNGFEEQADSVWKIGSSDRWEDHAHAFTEAVIASGDKEAARIGAELVSDCLECFALRMKAKAVAKVKLDISNLNRMFGHEPDCGRATV